jgi:hypothetical protein
MRGVAPVVALCLCALAGCVAKGERIDVAIPATSPNPAATSSGGPRVVVKPFDDARMDRTHLGSRAHLWGDTSYFDVPNGTVGEAVAKALVQQLTKRGWQASLDGSSGAAPDATISGTIHDLSVQAVSKVGHTQLEAKNTMMVRVSNHADESSIQERVMGTGSDEVFWFEPEDAQQLVNEVLEKNIEKFIADTKLDGRAVRLR